MKEFLIMDTPLSEVEEFQTLRCAFPRMTQWFCPHERPDTVLGHYLHFTHLPHHEKVNPRTSLSDDFYMTIRFDKGFKNISRSEEKKKHV